MNNNSKLEAPVTTVAHQTTNVIAPVISKSESVVKQEIKLVAHVSKPKTLAKAVEEPTVIEESTANQTLVSSSEVSIPTQTVADNNTVNEPYYFPAVDNNENKVAEKVTTTMAKSLTKNTVDNEKESVSNNEPPKIRFRPKKHGKFGYMKINRRR